MDAFHRFLFIYFFSLAVLRGRSGILRNSGLWYKYSSQTHRDNSTTQNIVSLGPKVSVSFDLNDTKNARGKCVLSP